MELRNESGLAFTRIDSEEFRRYTFPKGEAVQVDSPVALNVSKSGGHRLLDAAGGSHYVPPGWIHLEWRAREGAPHFVK